jgi:hypothetical protein
MGNTWGKPTNVAHAYRRAALRDRFNAERKHRMLCRRARMLEHFAVHGFPGRFAIKPLAKKYGLSLPTIRADIAWCREIYDSLVRNDPFFETCVEFGKGAFTVTVTPPPENEVITKFDPIHLLKMVHADSKKWRPYVRAIVAERNRPYESQKRSERRRKQKARERSGKSRPSLDTLDLVQVAEAFDRELQQYLKRFDV